MTPEEKIDALCEKINEIHCTVVSIDTWTKAHTREDDRINESHGKRLGILEQRAEATGRMIGASSALSAMLGAFVGIISGWFK